MSCIMLNWVSLLFKLCQSPGYHSEHRLALAVKSHRFGVQLNLSAGRLLSVSTCQDNTFAETKNNFQSYQYSPPDWASKLKYIPQYKVNLAHGNTPIHKWNVSGVPDGFSLHIKRDDMTGSTLSGNKVRKLEFLLADAIYKGCSHVITAGAIQSNNCQAVAVATRQLGLTPHLFLRNNVKDTSEFGCQANLLIDRMCGAHIYLVPRFHPFEVYLNPKMEKLADMIKAEKGETAYLIPVGGSSKIGLFGYLDIFEELRQQGVLDNFDDLVFTCGSGGTMASLAIGNYLTGSHLRCHGIPVGNNTQYYTDHVNDSLDAVGLGNIRSDDIVDIIDGYKGKGYEISTNEELDFVTDVSSSTGILLDPVYTGKAVYGLIQELTKNPGRFKGYRILFVHTGGIYGLFDGRMDSILKQSSHSRNTIKILCDSWGSD